MYEETGSLTHLFKATWLQMRCEDCGMCLLTLMLLLTVPGEIPTNTFIFRWKHGDLESLNDLSGVNDVLVAEPELEPS